MLSPPGQAGVTQSPEALVKIRRQREGEFSLGDEVSIFSCPYTFALLVLGNLVSVFLKSVDLDSRLHIKYANYTPDVHVCPSFIRETTL